MVVAYVGLGSNLESPVVQVERGFLALAGLPDTRLAARSRLYRTAPWGGIAQPDFVNAVAKLETNLDPQRLMRALLEVEHACGRRRDGERNGPRILDLDLLLYADLRIDEPGLHLPHPRLHERGFVLVPLAEIDGALDIPGHGPIARLLDQVDAARCVALSPS